MKLNLKVKTLMDQYGYTQASLAKKTGVSQNTIYKITSGETRKSKHLPALAAAFDLSTEELLSDEAPPKVEISPEKARLLRKIEDATESVLFDIEEAIDAIIKSDNIKKKHGI